jgi:SpoVK/Ycf46/Vps4 family AAA+-type ATPase
MSTAEQLKALIKSHFDDDSDRFFTISMQLAAHEARQGHATTATDIRNLIDQAKARKSGFKLVSFNHDFDDLLFVSEPRNKLAELVMPTPLRKRIERITLEYRQRAKLKQHGMKPRRKILLAGPPGTGKTLTASVLAGELHLPLSVILMDKLVTKFMGETGSKLRQVFLRISQEQGVYLFDEFDAIGGERSKDNDVGEMRRVLNAFLQFLERDVSDSLIIAATNNPKILDQALFRRFDDVLHYQAPTGEEIIHLVRNRLATFMAISASSTKTIAKTASGLSHAEITQACDDAIKDVILDGREMRVTSARLCAMFKERHAAYGTRG